MYKQKKTILLTPSFPVDTNFPSAEVLTNEAQITGVGGRFEENVWWDNDSSGGTTEAATPSPEKSKSTILFHSRTH